MYMRNQHVHKTRTSIKMDSLRDRPIGKSTKSQMKKDQHTQLHIFIWCSSQQFSRSSQNSTDRYFIDNKATTR